jgi:hypothetical protein
MVMFLVEQSLRMTLILGIILKPYGTNLESHSFMHITNTALCCTVTVCGKKEALLLLKPETAFMLNDLGKAG